MDFPAAPPSRCKWSPRCGEGPTSARIKDHSDANVLIKGRFLRCGPVSLREAQPRIDTDQEATTRHTQGTNGTEARVEGVSEKRFLLSFAGLSKGQAKEALTDRNSDAIRPPGLV